MIKISTIFFLMFFIVMGLYYQGLVENDKGEVFNNMNGTWLYNNISANFQFNESEGKIQGSINKIGDTVIYVWSGVHDWMVEFILKYPDIDWKLMGILFVLLFVFMILMPLLKLGVVLFILIYDYTKHLKEKKRLKDLGVLE